MQKYYPSKYKATNFNCTYCGVYSVQEWSSFYYYTPGGAKAHEKLVFCVCKHCHQWSYWFDGRMIIPAEAPVPLPHPDMPSVCLSEYNEARGVVSISPRAAVALLRLALQKLMVELGESGKNINDDIGNLVRKGLSPMVQQALDFCRVVGNNAVHPGELDINDTPEVAYSIFEMINFIVEDRISRPKQIEELYSRLPEGARKAIEKRDEPKD